VIGGFELEIKPLVLLINLDQDIERLKSSISQCDKIGITAIRIEATRADSLQKKSAFAFRQSTEACWESHLEALRYLIDSGEQYAIVLEDDFIIQNSSRFLETLSSLEKYNFDLIQLGFLDLGSIVKLNRTLENTQAILLRIFVLLGKMKIPFFKKNLNRMRIELIQETPKGFVPNSFLPGSHAYVISRNLAGVILRDYGGFLLPVDGFYNAISNAGGIRSFRISKSLVGQDMYPNSMRSTKTGE
jgi:GR25 family glycosyltransferase involved in LPS biosynthesis